MGIANRLKRIVRRAQRHVARGEVLHVRIFEHWYFLLSCPLTYFDVCAVNGATASGLENPNSKTQSYALYKAALERKRYRHIIVMLGEVDTGFVIWYRAKKYAWQRDGNQLPFADHSG